MGFKGLHYSLVVAWETLTYAANKWIILFNILSVHEWKHKNIHMIPITYGHKAYVENDFAGILEHNDCKLHQWLQFCIDIGLLFGCI